MTLLMLPLNESGLDLIYFEKYYVINSFDSLYLFQDVFTI